MTHTLGQYVSQYGASLLPGSRVTDTVVAVAGRVVSKRATGKLVFYDIEGDAGVRIQVMATLSRLVPLPGESDSGLKTRFATMNDGVHLGDIIGVAAGMPAKSKTGELSVIPTTPIQVLSTCSLDIPSSHFGLKNPEVRFRQRYLDMLVNKEVREGFVKRSKIISGIRSFLTARGFMEVETPILSSASGGANACPFTTHCRSLDTPLYLRVAPELFLKQCVIGGLDRVFELGKVFRNEGVDSTHSPEFTSCEFYQAYADLPSLMRTTEEIFRELCMAVHGVTTTTLTLDGKDIEIDFSKPFRQIDVLSGIKERIGVDVPADADAETLIAIIQGAKLPLPSLPHTPGRLYDSLIGSLLEPECVQPTFICNHPIALSPLAHCYPGKACVVQRFELFIGGKEVVNAYVELNDPDIQLQRFGMQAKDRDSGDAEAQPLDEAYCTSLRYGLPPTGGWGMGVDRVVMLLTNKPSIREVILFPMLRGTKAPTVGDAEEEGATEVESDGKPH